MSDLLQDLNFPTYSLNILLVFDSSLFEYLNGDALLGQDVLRHLHLAEGTLSKRFAFNNLLDRA